MKILIIVPSTRMQCQGLSAGAYARCLLRDGNQVLLLYHLDRLEDVVSGTGFSYESAALCWDGNHLARRLKKRVAAFDADVVHVWDLWNYVLAAALECSLINNAKLILHVEDDMLYLKEKKGIGNSNSRMFEAVYEGINDEQTLFAILKEKYDRGQNTSLGCSLMDYDYDPLLFWLAVKQCSGFTAIWHPLKQKLERCFGKPVELLPPGYDDEIQSPSEQQIAVVRQECCDQIEETNGDAVLLGHAGSIRHLDDEFGLFLAAVHRAHDEDPRIRLIIWGYDSDPQHTEQLIEQHDLRRVCLRYGAVSTERYRLLQAAVDIHCCLGIDSSFNRYRLPSRLCRLFHDGAAVLMYGVGFGESLGSGEEAILTHTNDASEWAEQVLRLVRDEKLRARISLGAKAYAAEHFDMEVNARRLASFYARVLSDLRYAGPFSRLVGRLRRMDVQNVALYGAGLHTQRMLAQGWLDDFSVTVIFDDDPRDAYVDIPVESLKMHEAYAFDVLVISSDVHEQQMLNKALAMNIPHVLAIHIPEVVK